MPRQPRQTWTQENGDVLKRSRREKPEASWAEIIKQGNLEGKTPKGCSNKWHNCLKSDFKDGKFSPEEDEQIMNHIMNQMINQIFNRNCRHLSWVSMVKDPLLKQRSTNAIKNRWNNHLKKTPEGTMILKLKDLMHDEASDHSVLEDGLKAWMAEFQSIVRGDDLEALIPNHDPNALHSTMETYTR